ncbi:sorting and assembly machinery component 50 [Dinochytrium kinnereticum]|nr:sorting and assembly machinery component 50 [Dinochytrium kinnereticum]
MENLYTLVDESRTRPFRVHAVRVEGAKLSGGYLFQKNISSLMNAKTLGEILDQSQHAAQRLSRLGVYKNVSVKLDVAEGSSGEDLEVTLVVDELSRVYARTLTSIGTNEGDVTMAVNLRNAFGGAEFVEGNVSYGVETNTTGAKQNLLPSETGSSFNFLLNRPIEADPDKRFELRAFKLSRNHSLYSSHYEHVVGISSGLKLLTRYPVTHDIFYTGSWRNNSDFSRDASWSTRKDGGHSFKSCISHTMTLDTRDDALLPSTGYYIRTFEEVAGLGGDVKHLKAEVEGHAYRSVWDDFIFACSGRMGAIYGLGTPSRINDRFFLGGPSSIRGFTQHGIGPKDRADSLGGDLYYAGGLSLFTPLPYLRRQPIRGHLFVNGGNIVMSKSGAWLSIPADTSPS